MLLSNLEAAIALLILCVRPVFRVANLSHLNINFRTYIFQSLPYLPPSLPLSPECSDRPPTQTVWNSTCISIYHHTHCTYHHYPPVFTTTYHQFHHNIKCLLFSTFYTLLCIYNLIGLLNSLISLDRRWINEQYCKYSNIEKPVGIQNLPSFIL